MKKPDEIPLKIQRLKGSPAWKLPDWQFGWYMKLLIEAADSTEPGYLGGSLRELSEKAGAKSAAYFQKWGGPELVSRFFKRAEDGTNRVYNERLLDVLQSLSNVACNAQPVETKEEKPKKRKKSEIYIGISLLPINEIYNSYPLKRNRDKALTAIQKAIKKIAREKGIAEIEAAEFLHKATLEFAKSPAGNKGKYTPYPATWFNSGDYMTDRSEWYRDDGEQQTSKQADRISSNRENIARAFQDGVDGGVDGSDAAALRAGIDSDSGSGYEGRLVRDLRPDRPGSISGDSKRGLFAVGVLSKAKTHS